MVNSAPERMLPETSLSRRVRRFATRAVNGLVMACTSLAGACHGTEPPPASAAFVGVDANYSLGMEQAGQQWRWNGVPDDLFTGMTRAGARGFRVRLWTKDEGPNGKAYATEVVRRAVAAGMDPYLVIFLSDDWADLMKQPAPAAWQDLSLTDRSEAVRNYSREVVAHFRNAGLTSHLYEIGNEVDYGICGVYPGKSTKKNPEGLRRRCWPEAAELIRASQSGVKASDPDARFMLHVSHWWDAKFVIAFFEFMLEHGVQVDVVGLSYFPSSNIGGSLEMEQFGAVVAAVHAAIEKPVIVPEVAYPSTTDFTGQFSRWKRAAPGYPLTPDGQRRWVDDFLAFCAHQPAISSVYYWSPEWCGEGMWKAFALFDPHGDAKPAWHAFAAARHDRPRPKQGVFLEILNGRLHAVPVAEARAASRAALTEKIEAFGRVNVSYIADITAHELVVGDYSVVLRASLSGNLDLALRPDTDGVADWRAIVEALDPATHRLVLFVRNPDDPLVALVQQAAQGRGVEAVVHPLEGKSPLRFGLGFTVGTDAAE